IRAEGRELRFTAAVVPSERWVKDDLRAASRGPSHRLGVAPSLVADHDAKLHTIDLEDTARIARDVEPVFTSIELVLWLGSEEHAIGVEHERGDHTAVV